MITSKWRSMNLRVSAGEDFCSQSGTQSFHNSQP
jgi:hypothetical protein